MPSRKQVGYTAAGSVIGFIVVALLIQLFAIALIPDRSTQDTTSLNQARTFLLQLLGGAVLLGGLFFTARTYLLTRSTQTAERFAKAIEQMGDQNSQGVRLGGIFGLGLVAEAEPGYWDTVDRILVAYIRDNGVAGQRVTPEVQACMDVLSKRGNRSNQPWRSLDLRNTQLQEADLAGHDLGRAVFDGAHLAQADLTDAVLVATRFCDADLDRTVLSGADCRRANFTDTDLTTTTLTNTRLDAATMPSQQPAAGQPAAGQPAAGQPAAGQPAASASPDT